MKETKQKVDHHQCQIKEIQNSTETPIESGQSGTVQKIKAKTLV